MIKNARIQWPDILKAFAIILVIIGHVVSTYDVRGYDSPIARWIYSFHMPLFMMLSGMFFKYTLDKPFWSMIKIKCRTLLLPLFSWSIILLLFQLIVTTPFSEWEPCVKDWILSGGPLRGYWYLKCLFLYLVIGYISVELLKNELIAAITTTALFLIFPNVNFSKMMILFFWFGYGYNIVNQFVTNRGGYIAIFALIMAGCYWVGWYKYTYLGVNSIEDYCKFIIMGTSSSLFWIMLFNLLFKNNSHNSFVRFIAWIGTVSLGIYCLHVLFYDPLVFGTVLGDISKYGLQSICFGRLWRSYFALLL